MENRKMKHNASITFVACAFRMRGMMMMTTDDAGC